MNGLWLCKLVRVMGELAAEGDYQVWEAQNSKGRFWKPVD